MNYKNAVFTLALLFSSSLQANEPPQATAGEGACLSAQLIYALEGRPTPQCHASTIVETPSGFVAAWFGGTREKNPDVGIWVSRQVNGEWSTPDKVLDLSAQVTCDRWLKGKKETVTLNAKKTSFVLDGKLAPPKIAAVAGREAVLCHYRSDKVPHKILVRSHDDSIRGMIVAMNAETLRLASPVGSHQVTIGKDALYQVDGAPADLQAVIKKGGQLVIYPKRGRTIIAFAPVEFE